MLCTHVVIETTQVIQSLKAYSVKIAMREKWKAHIKGVNACLAPPISQTVRWLVTDRTRLVLSLSQACELGRSICIIKV